MPAIERRLTELPVGAQAVVRMHISNPADQRVWRSAADLDLQWVDSLAEAFQSLEIPHGDGFVWAAGENRVMAELRKQVTSKPGLNPKRMRIASYWKQGEVDHHEELMDS